MAQTTTQIKVSYPLPAYNYRVSILPVSTQGLTAAADVAQVAGVGTAISCSEVSGLSMEIETVTYKDGFSFITGNNIIPTQRKEVNLSLKRGLTSNHSYFSDWISLLYPLIAPKPASLIRKRDIVIDLCDEQGNPVVRWLVFKAMPIKLEAPTFDANTNEVAFEQMDLIANQLRVEYQSSA